MDGTRAPKSNGPPDSTAVLYRYVEVVWGQGNIEAIDTFLAREYRRYLSPVTEPLGRDGQKQLLLSFRRAFPDIELVIEDVVAEGDRVAFRSTIRGTHTGEFRGIAPTNASITVSLVDIVRIANGRIIEQWGGPDLLDLLRQLGATITPPG